MIFMAGKSYILTNEECGLLKIQKLIQLSVGI